MTGPRPDLDRHDEWDAYVNASPGATFFHQAGWMRAVRDIYGHSPRYLLAREPEAAQSHLEHPTAERWFDTSAFVSPRDADGTAAALAAQGPVGGGR